MTTPLARYCELMPVAVKPNWSGGKQKRVPWEPEERQWLKDNYAKLGRQACADYLGRTNSSIKQQAKLVGATLGCHWTKYRPMNKEK